MATASTASLVDALELYRLLDPGRLDEVKALRDHFPDPNALAGELIRRGWLTPFQADKLLQGRGGELALGTYVLLEKLGEGGMGEVYRAMHRSMGRVVALKLIREERLSDPNAVRRFEREVRAAAALSHPNVVLAFDADQIGGTHLLVMEYVEQAIDLSQLVRKDGPLPVARACDYARQAAVGLQHAHERGMVHRDIKPANLLLASNGIVKVLDMGLARLDLPVTGTDRGSTMTREGTVMGTPDYLAPEQAVESHTVDIRADLYSLGCTLYFLLTGKVPFPGGSLAEKLVKHQLHEPRRVEELRPGVPAGVAGVVRKLMAKRPEARYQTPAEAAAALARFGAESAGTEDETFVERLPAALEAPGDGLTSLFQGLPTGNTVEAESPGRLRRGAEGWRLLLYGAAGCGFLLAGVAVLWFLLRPTGGEGPPVEGGRAAEVVSLSTPRQGRAVDVAWLDEVATMPGSEQVAAVAGKLKDLNPGFDGKVTHRSERGVVTRLGFLTDDVTDISPVRALAGLRALECGGGGWNKGRLADLKPLGGMGLTSLDFHSTLVADLTPLEGMKLYSLTCYNTPVADLKPLKGMRLEQMFANATRVSDLSPLAGMRLTQLGFAGARVGNLSPLKGMPLVDLWCDFVPGRDAEILRPIESLKTINGKPAKEFWQEVDAK